MKAKRQEASRIVCAISRFAGSLAGAAMVCGKKIGTYLKGSIGEGEVPSHKVTVEPGYVPSADMKPATVSKPQVTPATSRKKPATSKKKQPKSSSPKLRPSGRKPDRSPASKSSSSSISTSSKSSN